MTSAPGTPGSPKAAASGDGRRGLDPALLSALAAEGERLSSLDDPVAVLQEATDFYSVLDQVAAELVGSVRLQAINELRAQGWSHLRIAEACGLTRQRVSQLVHEGSRSPA